MSDPGEGIWGDVYLQVNVVADGFHDDVVEGIAGASDRKKEL